MTERAERNIAPASAGEISSTSAVAGETPLFRNRNYLLHWASTALFSLADYFTLIAMPWLVLSITHDPAALGVVMALESLPRAIFMLISGRFSDRYTPRMVLLFSRGGFVLALTALALLILYGNPQVEQLHAFAFVFGLLAAFAMPAATALLPQLVAPEQMERGNSALMGTQQTVQLLAPVLAGLLIWSMPAATALAPSADVDFAQIAYTFMVSAAAVFVALLMLLNIRLVPLHQDTAADETRLVDGFLYLWRDRGLRIVTLYMAGITFFAMGPMLTVIPLFADRRLDAGALSYGLLFAANGLGAVIGFTVAGMSPKPGARMLGPVMFTADLVAGLCVAWYGHSYSLAAAAPALALIGVANSVMVVLCLSWIQRRIPPALTGHVLGLVMFATMGLTPVSMALSGFFLAKYSITTLLTLSSIAISSCALLGLLVPGINRFGTYAVPEASSA